jgi:L-glyceraldehyde 3-phosphate reductase
MVPAPSPKIEDGCVVLSLFHRPPHFCSTERGPRARLRVHVRRLRRRDRRRNALAYAPSPARYDAMTYNRCGRSGLHLPAISLGLWHNFGFDQPAEKGRAICRQAFDLGITHFDLANNYGPPPGSAETAFGEIMRGDFQGLRDELVISTKAGYRMWPGPYGEWGSRKYLLSSLDQSLRRMGLDYVDIFYSHRYDPDTPLEETMGALDSAVRQGKALYVGISSYNAQRTREALAILRDLGTPCIIHQPSYSLINRWIEEDGLLNVLDTEGLGCIVFSPLAQGMLTSKYLGGIPQDSRAAAGKSLRTTFLNEENIERARKLDAIAQRRGQTLAQMALAWVLRGGRVTSALIGASRPEQVVDCVEALKSPGFTAEELAEIDSYAVEGGVNLWAASAERAGPQR